MQDKKVDKKRGNIKPKWTEKHINIKPDLTETHKSIEKKNIDKHKVIKRKKKNYRNTGVWNKNEQKHTQKYKRSKTHKHFRYS